MMKPIIMSSESVRAILAGRKTETRRVVKPQPETTQWLTPSPETAWTWQWPRESDLNTVTLSTYGLSIMLPHFAPLQVGDRLWVRETWCNPDYASRGERSPFTYYKADNLLGDAEWPWRSPIYMPRWASRITLEVTDNRAERLHDITYEDIIAEGWDPRTSEPVGDGTAGEEAWPWYMDLWERLNPQYPWASNPWVWVIEFWKEGWWTYTYST